MQNSEKPFNDYSWRQQHIGRLLFEVQKDFQFRSIEQLRELGYHDITLASINIIASTSTAGTRLSDIAKNLDISKQAAGQMVKDLVDKGYLLRQADPDDGRATLVSFTKKGKKLLDEAKGGIDDIETFYANLLGNKSFTSLKKTLMELLEHTQT